MIRESREDCIDVVQKVDHRAELLIVGNIFEVMVLANVRIKPNRREAPELPTYVEETKLFKVRVARNRGQYATHRTNRSTNVTIQLLNCWIEGIDQSGSSGHRQNVYRAGSGRTSRTSYTGWRNIGLPGCVELINAVRCVLRID